MRVGIFLYFPAIINGETTHTRRKQSRATNNIR